MYNKELDTFLIVAKTGSFSKAAKELYISKNAVMQQINLLEASLDLTLFKRTTHGVTLTNAGRILVSETKRIKKLTNQINESLASYKNTIYAGSGFLNHPFLINKYWPVFHQRNPNTKLKFVEMSDYENISENINLFEGSFSERPFLRQGFSFVKTGHTDLIAIIPEDDPLKNKTILRPTDFKNRKVAIPNHNVYQEMAKVENYLIKKVPKIILENYDTFNTAVINNANIQGKILIISRALSELVSPKFIKKIVWPLKINYGIYYRKNSNKLCQKFIQKIIQAEN